LLLIVASHSNGNRLHCNDSLLEKTALVSDNDVLVTYITQIESHLASTFIKTIGR